MAKLPRPLMLSKEEFQVRDSAIKLVKDFPVMVKPTNLVSCPWKNYEVATTVNCSTCVYWYGFAPRDPSKPISQENIFSVCAYPIGRRITFCV